MNTIRLGFLGVALAAAALTGFLAARFTGSGSPGTSGAADMAGEGEVLYWVAPMDPNFRRDAPGKSPMGMDLVPVYADGDKGGASAEPALRIEPAIVNNIGVRTAAVRRQDMPRIIRTVGNVMADQEKRSDIHVRSEGWIETLTVETVGERVEKGDLLFRIYSPELVTAQGEYLQILMLDRPTLAEAAEERLAAMGMGKDQIAALRQQRKVQRLVDVHAPQSGVVTEIDVREGMFVQPATMVMRLADLSTIWVMADIFETASSWVAEGQRAQMTLAAFPGETWEGRIDYVYPTADARTRTVQTRLRFDNEDGRLRPNMFANLSIEAAPKENALVIPAAALIRHSSQDRVVLALGEGRFRPAAVRAGTESGGLIEILDGLNAGETVVTSSQFLIDSEAGLDASLLRLTSSMKQEGGTEPQMQMDDMKTESAEASGAGMDKEMPAEEPRRASGEGRITEIDAASRRLTLDHEPIAALGWPSMVMGFAVSADVDLDAFEKGTRVRFVLRQTDAGHEIVALEPLAAGNAAEDKQ
ncbi:MAG: efflux RND transporter periplasmic adaptor subunit [Parvibaculum sp.]|jgi:membrane fusion protein, copper/silver efflux system|uniref:efflux RND transporter periplasmic adaptor subunit n=1 Tax=Parvibaculum sp. TaxID=2024848 RepID=UPI003263564A